LEQLRAELIKAGDVGRLEFPGLRPDRIPVLPGGFAIMSAIFSELEVPDGVGHRRHAAGHPL